MMAKPQKKDYKKKQRWGLEEAKVRVQGVGHLREEERRRENKRVR